MLESLTHAKSYPRQDITENLDSWLVTFFEVGLQVIPAMGSTCDRSYPKTHTRYPIVIFTHTLIFFHQQFYINCFCQSKLLNA